MGGFVQGITSLFGGGASADAASAAAQQQQLSTIAQQRSDQAAQDASAATGAITSAPRGQRLLTSTADGGLATKLGGSS